MRQEKASGGNAGALAAKGSNPSRFSIVSIWKWQVQVWTPTPGSLLRRWLILDVQLVLARNRDRPQAGATPIARIGSSSVPETRKEEAMSGFPLLLLPRAVSCTAPVSFLFPDLNCI
ncbi:hypothetical protein CSPX01_06683 [Colletotrichum filicis]|nr:hypothetical protein CSPX01_06683 [Colletotrichum filicis]